MCWVYLFELIDFVVFVGKCVGVVGVGVFVFDNVGIVLEVGVVCIDLFFCCVDILCINKLIGIGSLGFVYGYVDFDDVMKWCFMYYVLML